MNTLYPPLKLPPPGSSFQSAYQRVKADPRLGQALEEVLIPSLEAAGSPTIRMATFEKGRLAAIGSYYQAAAGGEPYLTKRELEVPATGLGPHPALDAFDMVATDLLYSWFLSVSQSIATRNAPLRDRRQALEDLEAMAASAFSWRPSVIEAAVLSVKLAKAGMLEKPVAA